MAKILKNHCSPPLPFTGFVYILMTVNFRPLCDSCDKKMDSKCDDVARWDCRPERWNRVKQTPFEFKKMSMSSGLSHFMILRYLLFSLFSWVVLPMQAESFLPALGEPPVKRERTTYNVKSWNGTGLVDRLSEKANFILFKKKIIKKIFIKIFKFLIRFSKIRCQINSQ